MIIYDLQIQKKKKRSFFFHREQVFVSQAISELQNPSVDPADIDLEESISDRRMASSPAGYLFYCYSMIKY